jgi:energy-coupling factor transporter ATP-binding protein EcfA2
MTMTTTHESHTTPITQTGRRVVRLQAENFKRLKAVDIAPAGDVVLLTGANGQGKSSVIDALMVALTGRKGMAAIDRPVRDGADRAEVRVDLGDLIVTRRWVGERSEAVVTTPDGVKYPGGADAVLKTLANRIGFDPLAFINAGPSDQLNMLLGVVELPFDPAELARQRTELMADRRAAKKAEDAARAAYEAMPPVPAGVPDEEVNLSALANDLQDVLTANADRARARTDVERAENYVAELEARLAAAREAAELARGHRDRLGPVVDPAPYQRALAEAENVNAMVAAKERRADARVVYETAAERTAAVSDAIVELDEYKAAALAAAAMPVPGLGFDDDGVTLNGLPFSSASSAEKLRVSTAIGMAASPELRVMWVRDGSLLDRASMAELELMASENDFQLWIERVDESGTVGIVIEDGEVR